MSYTNKILFTPRAKEIFIVYTGFANLCFTKIEDAERFKSDRKLDTIIYKHGEVNPNIIEVKKTECSYKESVENMANESMFNGKSFKHSGFSIGRNIY